MTKAKAPASDPEAEQAVLGCCMIGPEAVKKTLLLLEQRDFYHHQNVLVFQAIADLADGNDGEGIDVIMVASRLREAGLLEAAGGPEYLMEAVNKGLHVGFCENYARVVRRHSLSRSITAALRKTYEEESPEAMAELSELVMAKDSNDSSALFDFRHDLMPTLKGIVDFSKPHYQMGFDQIDDALGGVDAGDLVTIGARTSGGKTAFMLRIALNMAMASHEVLYITSEMRIDSIVRRLLPQLTNLPSWKFRKRALDDNEKRQAVEQGHAALSTLPIKMLAKGRVSIKDIRSAVLNSGCKIVFVDYLQRCKLPKASMESTAIYEFMADFKEVLLNTATVGFIASQLDRKRDKTPDEKPTLSDFRGSSGIESESDISILLYKPSDKKDAPAQVIPVGAGCVRVKALIAKGRDSGSGREIDMDLHTDSVKFLEASMNQPGEDRFA